MLDNKAIVSSLDKRKEIKTEKEKVPENVSGKYACFSWVIR